MAAALAAVNAMAADTVGKLLNPKDSSISK
jgi:hypothetical protein